MKAAQQLRLQFSGSARKVDVQPTVLDLFCGIGGFSYGAARAGYRVLLGVDHDETARRTFETNHSNARFETLDLASEASIDAIKEILNGERVDVIVAGPPCQGFSLTGPRQLDDPRNALYMAVFRAVKQLKPAAFVIENVPGMATLYGGQILRDIVGRFRDLGYKVPDPAVLCAADFGVPQLRRRLFIVGTRDELPRYTYPEPFLSPENYVSTSDAIGDLPARTVDLGQEVDSYESPPITEYQKLMRGHSTCLCNHVATRHTEHVKSVISLVPEGGNFRDLPPGVGTSRTFNEAWTRYHSARPSRTIDTGHRNHFHYRHNRVPTIRENARLQSFPDSFVFYGTRTEQNRQVGNAVPPLLAEAIAVKLLDCF